MVDHRFLGYGHPSCMASPLVSWVKQQVHAVKASLRDQRPCEILDRDVTVKCKRCPFCLKGRSMLNVPVVSKAGHARPKRFDFSIITLASASPAANFIKLGVTSQRASRERTRMCDWVLCARLMQKHGRVHINKSASTLAPTLH